MFNHELYATSLARAVDVMRQADAREQQKGALRAVVALAASSSATIRCYDGQLSMDDVGISPDLPHIGTLTGRMAAHGIAEIAVGRGAEPAELLALLRGLADSASAMSVKDRLREARSARIWVLLTDLDEPRTSGGRTSLSNLFEPEQPAAPVAPGPTRSKLSAMKREEEEALAMWNDLHTSGGSQSAMKEVDLGFDADAGLDPTGMPAPAARAPEPEPEPVPGLPIDAATPLGAALAAVARKPADTAVLDKLARFADSATAALSADQVVDVLKGVALLTRLELEAPEGTTRNSYRITLGRILSRDTLVQMAPHATEPELADEVGRVFARAGGAATEVLLGLLASAESPRERRGYMTALKGIPSGHDQIIQMLGHHQWFVARNVAELAGEMKLEAAVDALGAMLEHKDPRVRRAAAMALAKIGTPGIAEPMLRAMAGGANETRALIASLVGSAHAVLFTAPIAVQLQTEEDPEVLKELCLALGRINTSDATQALEQARKSGGLFSRRARALKEAAEAALQKVRR